VRERFRQWIETLKRDTLALWFAYKHPDTPWYAKLWTAVVVGYALSPIDLIPDFIPILGYLDDLVLVPAGIWIALQLIPPHALAEGRKAAMRWLEEARGKPRNLTAAVVIVVLWVVALVALVVWLRPMLIA
jgi:uncharacterized membrane protein YkvA (DUF1232 family)